MNYRQQFLSENPLPHSKEAEMAVLSAFFHNSSARGDSDIKVDDLYFEHHRLIFRVMVEIYFQGKTIDIDSVSEKLSNSNKLEDVGGRSVLERIFGCPLTEIDIHIETVKRMAQSRRDMLKSFDKTAL